MLATNFDRREVCGYVNGKNSSGEYVGEKPFHGVFLGMDNARGLLPERAEQTTTLRQRLMLPALWLQPELLLRVHPDRQ